MLISSKSGNPLAVQTAPTQDAKSAFADWILTRTGGFRAPRRRDFNRQGDFPTQPAFADWILTRAGGFRAPRRRDFNRPGDSPNRL